MARTLSDTVIVAMIEAATRLAGGRGPIAGSSAAAAAPMGSATPLPGSQADSASAAPTPTAAALAGGVGAPTATMSSGAAGLPPAAPADRDLRTAEQIAADFRTIFAQIDEVVRAAAEQETKSVGFTLR